MATSRTRTRSLPGQVGSKTSKTGNNPPTVSYNAYSHDLYQETSDTVGAWDSVNSFSSEGYKWSRTPMSGKNTSGFTTVEYDGFIPAGVATAPPSHLSVAAPPSDSVSVTQAVSRTHPGRPSVSVPVFVAELRDLPRAVKQFGDLLDNFKQWRANPYRRREYLESLQSLRDIGGYYLGIEFGWRPLISDLKKMLEFTEAVDRRINEMRNLQRKGGLRRRYTVHDVSSSDSATVVMNGSQPTTNARRHRSTRRRKWVTIRWVSTELPKYVPRDAERDRIRKILLAMDGSSSTNMSNLWNALPWTWLVDWFANVGDYLRAHSNNVPTQPTKIAIMTSIETEGSFTVTNAQWTSGGGATFSRWGRYRSPGTLSPLPTVSLPFLSGRQLSILGALAATRARYGS
ncbi:maturation protein [ssRNA phage SRR5466727_10]|uniref:Maturation protein n=1 Tax=ssRNA phage SRR5466727_10 TaxID=2786430 RepID=A0A8S5L5D4_9VIRU|nr:maturation protein [ssRNA phage SRR5466727_10]DAD52450.1 TPA_asm: maturation protein [ssRNA phage SRR5466727_10]